MAEKAEQKKPIAWVNSKAKKIILLDLQEGILPLDSAEVSAREAWDKVYGKMIEFQDVPYEQFRDRLNSHRNQVTLLENQSFEGELALAHDRLLHPRQTHNHRGEPVFDLSSAKLLLREDVKNELHTTMDRAELQASRPEYMCFNIKVFKDRIYQEVRRKKFIAYLEAKRAIERLPAYERAYFRPNPGNLL